MLLPFILIATAASAAPAPSPRAELKAAVEQLRSSPDDQALREKIIKLAKKAKPAVPEEARHHFVKAVAMQKEAKSPEDFDLPIEEYRKALAVAPWWADAYYNLATVLESRKRYAEAIANLKLSVLASPSERDARAAQDKVYALEGKMELAAKATAKKEAEANNRRIVPGRSMGPYELNMTSDQLRSKLGAPKNVVNGNDGTWASYEWDSIMAFTDMPSDRVSALQTTESGWSLADGLSVGSSESALTSRNPYWVRDTTPPDYREYCFEDGLWAAAHGGQVAVLKVWSPGCKGQGGHFQCYTMSGGMYHIGRCVHD